MSLGADPLVSALTVVSAERGKDIDGLLVRKQAKDHGTARLIEGPLRPGLTAVVLEDTSTTGASALQACRALKDAGVVVNKVITLIDRGEGAGQAIEAVGLEFEAIFSAADVLGGYDPVISQSNEPDVDVAAAGDRVTASAAGSSSAAISGSKGASSPPKPKALVLQTDGSSIGNPGPAGAGWVLLDGSASEVGRGSSFLGRATNNVAEYRALLLGLAAANAKGATHVVVRMDSELIVKQMTGRYRVRHPDMLPLNEEARKAVRDFTKVRFEYVPRERNNKANDLAQAAAKRR